MRDALALAFPYFCDLEKTPGSKWAASNEGGAVLEYKGYWRNLWGREIMWTQPNAQAQAVLCDRSHKVRFEEKDAPAEILHAELPVDGLNRDERQLALQRA